MDKTPKIVLTIRVNPDIKELLNRLNLDKARIAEQAFKDAIVRRLRLLKFDKRAIDDAMLAFLAEEKRADEQFQLLCQNLEQNEYAEKKQDSEILTELQMFCKEKNLDQVQFSKHFMDEPVRAFVQFEQEFSDRLESHGYSSRNIGLIVSKNRASILKTV
jgi:predicted transcriptional regulator